MTTVRKHLFTGQMLVHNLSRGNYWHCLLFARSVIPQSFVGEDGYGLFVNTFVLFHDTQYLDIAFSRVTVPRNEVTPKRYPPGIVILRRL